MHTHCALYTVAQYPSVCHKPVVYQNGIMDWAGFRHIGYLHLILHCVVNAFGFLQKMRVLPSWPCPTLSTAGSPLVIGVEDTEDSKTKDGRRWSLSIEIRRGWLLSRRDIQSSLWLVKHLLIGWLINIPPFFGFQFGRRSGPRPLLVFDWQVMNLEYLMQICALNLCDFSAFCLGTSTFACVVIVVWL